MKKVELMIAFVFCFLPNFTFANKEVGNGGAACALDFAKYGRAIYQAIRTSDYYKSKIDFSKLDAAINSTHISVVERKLTDRFGGTVMASNNGKDKILLSKADWCEAYKPTQAEIVLNEYLGISQPGTDHQGQLSGALYVQTGYSEDNFLNYLYSRSDFLIERIRFRHVLLNQADYAVIETKSIKEYFNLIGIDESLRYGFRAKFDCTKGSERLDLYSIYANYDPTVKPAWFYAEKFLNSFSFNDPNSCLSVKNRAILIGEDGLDMNFGLNTLKIIGHN